MTGLMLGQLDPPLSEKGKLQAQALAGLSVKVAYSSPLQRASETAVEIGCPVLTLPELREIDQGEWTGLTWTQIESRWSEHAALKLEDWLGTPAPGGETWQAFLMRIQIAWNCIRLGPTPAAIVAHQGVNAALLYLMEGRDPLNFAQQYGEMIRVDLS